MGGGWVAGWVAGLGWWLVAGWVRYLVSIEERQVFHTEFLRRFFLQKDIESIFIGEAPFTKDLLDGGLLQNIYWIEAFFKIFIWRRPFTKYFLERGLL